MTISVPINVHSMSPRQAVNKKNSKARLICDKTIPDMEETEHSSSSTVDNDLKLTKFLMYQQRQMNMLNKSSKRHDESTITSATSGTTRSSLGSTSSEPMIVSSSRRSLRRGSIRIVNHPQMNPSKLSSKGRSLGDVAIAPPKRHLSFEAPKDKDNEEINGETKTERKGSTSKRLGSSTNTGGDHDHENELHNTPASSKKWWSLNGTPGDESGTKRSSSRSRRSSRTKNVRSSSYDKATHDASKSSMARRGSRPRRSSTSSIVVDPASLINIDEPSERSMEPPSMEPPSPRGRKEHKSVRRNRSKSNKPCRGRGSRDKSTDLTGLDSGSKQNGKLAKESSRKQERKDGKGTRHQKLEDDKTGSKNSRNRHNRNIGTRQKSRSKTSDQNKVPERLTRAIDRSSMNDNKHERAALAIFLGDDDDDLSETFEESVASLPAHLLDPANIPLTLQW